MVQEVDQHNLFKYSGQKRKFETAIFFFVTRVEEGFFRNGVTTACLNMEVTAPVDKQRLIM